MSYPHKEGGNIPNGDNISQLPVDQSQPSLNELNIVNSLFTNHKEGINSIVNELKDSVIVGALFIIFSLPPIDNCLHKILPFTQRSPYIMVVIKSIAVMALYWLIKHFYLSRK